MYKDHEYWRSTSACMTTAVCVARFSVLSAGHIYMYCMQPYGGKLATQH